MFPEPLMEAEDVSEQRRTIAFEREHAPPRRRRFWAVLLLLAAICGFAVYRSALFRLESIEVVGGKRLTTERVMEIAGLEKGAPRWEHSASAIAERLNQEPWVKSVKVEWNLSRLRVTLQEREAVGLLRYYDLYYLALDESGLILEQTDMKVAKGLPVVSGVSVTKALRGQRLAHQGLGDALAALARMAESLRSQVSEVHVDNDRTLTLFMTGGATVLWGQVEQGKDRLARVEQRITLFADFWRTVSKRSAAGCRIDLRVDDRVIGSGC